MSKNQDMCIVARKIHLCPLTPAYSRQVFLICEPFISGSVNVRSAAFADYSDFLPTLLISSRLIVFYAWHTVDTGSQSVRVLRPAHPRVLVDLGRCRSIHPATVSFGVDREINTAGSSAG